MISYIVLLLLVTNAVGSNSATGTWIFPKITNYLTQSPVLNSQANPLKLSHDINGNAILLWSQFNGSAIKLHSSYWDYTSKPIYCNN